MGDVAALAVKLLGICVLTAALCSVLRNTSPLFAWLMAAAGGVAVMLSLADGIGKIWDTAEKAATDSGISGEVLVFAAKGVGIAWLTGITADVARDAGEQGIAKKAELVGKICVLMLCLPVMEGIFSDIAGAFSGF